MKQGKDTGNYLDDRLIVLSESASPAILDFYNLPMPLVKVDLSRYRIVGEVYAGRVLMPVLDEKT